MNGSNIEFVVTSTNDIKDVCQVMASIGSMTLYITPDLIEIASITRLMFNGKFNIVVMVDYPDGHHKGIDKFKGVNTNFFLTDGYDVVLTTGLNDSDIENEIKTIGSFIKTMINPTIDIIYTINASMRSKHEIEVCASALGKMPPSKIKLESSTTVQPTKANFDIHKNTIDTIRKYCAVPIVVSGNVTYNIYKEFSKEHKIAISINQYKQMKKHEELERAKSSII